MTRRAPINLDQFARAEELCLVRAYSAKTRDLIAGLLRLDPPPEAQALLHEIDEIADQAECLGSARQLHDLLLHDLTAVWRDWSIELQRARDDGQLARSA